MLRQLRTIIIVNAVLILLFILTNYGIWDVVTSNTHLGHTSMNAFNVVESIWGDVVDGQIYRIDGMFIMPNFPFWLFFISTAANLILFVKLIRDYELKQKPT